MGGRARGACALFSSFSCCRRSTHPPAPSQPRPFFFLLGRIRLVRDTKVENAATFIIAREDHTVGNALRGALAADADVVFAGYRIPHPLEHVMHVRVATSGRDGARGPRGAVSKALDDLADEVGDVRAKFLEAGAAAGGVGLAQAGGGGGGMGGGGMGGMPGGGMGDMMGGGLPPPQQGGFGGGGGGGDPYGGGYGY